MNAKRPNENDQSSEALNEIRKSVQDFFQMKPVKGFLQSMDEFFHMPLSTFPVEVKESDKEFQIVAELPGVHRDHISIDCFERYILISVNKFDQHFYHDEVREIHAGKSSSQMMTRRIMLHTPFDESLIKASYQNGLLRIYVPKKRGNIITIQED